MQAELIAGALGAEIKGISLKDSSPENWKQINELMLSLIHI
mgnify:CR=1 FL=1